MSRCTSTRCSANSVHIDLSDFRQIKIDHKINAGHINAARCDICCNQYGQGAFAESGERLFTLALGFVAVNCSCIDAVTDQTLGNMLKTRQFRDISIGLIREGMAVAKALNIHVEPATGGKLDYYSFLKGDNWFGNQYRHLVMRLIGFKHGKVVTSSLQDIRKGKPTEIPYLNGWICEQTDTLNIDTPLNHAIVSLIKDVEAGRKKQSLDILRELE